MPRFLPSFLPSFTKSQASRTALGIALALSSLTALAQNGRIVPISLPAGASEAKFLSVSSQGSLLLAPRDASGKSAQQQTWKIILADPERSDSFFIVSQGPKPLFLSSPAEGGKIELSAAESPRTYWNLTAGPRGLVAIQPAAEPKRWLVPDSTGSGSVLSLTSIPSPVWQIPRPALEPFTVAANLPWVDTGIELFRGESFQISADGRWSNGGDTPQWMGAGGFANFRYQGTALGTAELGSLIGKVGTSLFAIGAGSKTLVSPNSGRLHLAMNDTTNEYADNQGSLRVTIR
jgi:hypothetical protein